MLQNMRDGAQKCHRGDNERRVDVECGQYQPDRFLALYHTHLDIRHHFRGIYLCRGRSGSGSGAGADYFDLPQHAQC